MKNYRRVTTTTTIVVQYVKHVHRLLAHLSKFIPYDDSPDVEQLVRRRLKDEKGQQLFLKYLMKACVF